MVRFAAILRATAEVVAAWRTRARTENMFLNGVGRTGSKRISGVRARPAFQRAFLVRRKQKPTKKVKF